jgi:hypothetical protein
VNDTHTIYAALNPAAALNVMDKTKAKNDIRNEAVTVSKSSARTLAGAPGS